MICSMKNGFDIPKGKRKNDNIQLCMSYNFLLNCQNQSLGQHAARHKRYDDAMTYFDTALFVSPQSLETQRYVEGIRHLVLFIFSLFFTLEFPFSDFFFSRGGFHTRGIPTEILWKMGVFIFLLEISSECSGK